MKLRTVYLASLAGFLFLSGPAFAKAPLNQLTEPEKQAGWELLFDGKSTDGWRNFKKEEASDGWKIQDGELTRTGKAGDIMTKEQYENFELQLEYKISKGGNSGLMFHVTEEESKPWQTGPEIQIQDNGDAHDPQLSGWLYQLYKPGGVPGWAKRQLEDAGKKAPDKIDTTRPAGEWNHIYLKISPGGCKVCMNGQTYYNFKKGNGDWDKKVAASKFAKFENFGKPTKGHICLQDHGNDVAFRNIKIRNLDDNVKNPVHGTIAVEGKPAFPNLTWAEWEPENDEGKQEALRTIVLTEGGDGYLYTASQKGMVHRFKNNQDKQEAELVLDLRPQVKHFRERGANEEGLLGLAFHPKFKDNGRLFVYYTSKPKKLVSIVSEFKLKDGKVDRDDEKVIMEIEQPFMNHNGGSIEFGPDGYLYIGMGDGGLANDPYSAGQDLGKVMGKILRVDIDKQENGKAYGIPADNPFVKHEGAKPEIYAYGLRNVWRMGFDQKTGHLWAADVGQDLWEEVNIIKKGGNYGWSVREGSYGFKNDPVTSKDPLIDPVWEYDHQIGRSITGGYVCRSSRIAELDGKYIYADYVSGRIWALEHSDNETKNYGLIDGGMPVLAFGQDGQGEVYYLLEAADGKTIYRFESK